MKNIIKKIIYACLSLQEKSLQSKLHKNLKGSYANNTSKTILSATEHVTFDAETKKNIDLVRKNIEDILKSCENNPNKLLNYIQAAGTKVIKLNYADKILKFIGEEEGLICELKGFKALYINLHTQNGFSLSTKPMFLLRKGLIDPLFMIHNFYRWYSLKMNLPGFDYKSQQNLKKYLKNPNHKDISKLSIKDTLQLQEAVARDKEATTFCIELAQKTEGGQKVKQKMQEGGADI